MARSAVATDDFERASLGTNWTTVIGTPTIYSSSDAAGTDTANDNTARWNANSFATNQYAKAVIAALANNRYADACVRMSTDTGANRDDYGASTDGRSTETSIYKYVNGTYSTLASISQAFSAGDSIELEATGVDPTTLQMYRNGAAVGSSTSDSSNDSGYAGWSIYNSTANAARIENWEGGDLVDGGLSISLSETISLSEALD